MKNYLISMIAVLILFPVYSIAQTKTICTADENAVRQIVQNIQDAWAAGDGVKWADQFVDDIDFTVWNGKQISGREENLKSHQQIFDTIYKGTEIRTKIKKIRFLTDEVAAVHLESTMYKDGNPVKDVPTVLPLLVLKKEEGKWRIAVFQNTPIIKRGELVVGRTSKSGKEEE